MCHYLPKNVMAEYKAAYYTPLHEHFVHVDGLRRRFLLYEPHLPNRPIWLLAPGTVSPAEQILAISGLYDMAREHKFGLVVLEGFHCTFNVQLKSQQMIQHPSDIGYVMKVLRLTAARTSPDMSRIHCVGYSNGARFCCRLASELSNILTSFATVAGIRYPSPNNASMPMPAIAFHGVKDPVNPFWGHGNPTYWHTSVPDALQGWARFNGCSRKEYKKLNESVSIERYVNCHHGADVVLWRMEETGHTWPGSHYNFSRFGLKFGRTSTISANEAMRQFFHAHPRTLCHTAVPGERCYYDVAWARKKGMRLHPEWYPGVTNDSSFEDVQGFLHRSIRANCPQPCEPAASTTAAAPPGGGPVGPWDPGSTIRLPEVVGLGAPLWPSTLAITLAITLTVLCTAYSYFRGGAAKRIWRPVGSFRGLRDFVAMSCRDDGAAARDGEGSGEQLIAAQEVNDRVVDDAHSANMMDTCPLVSPRTLREEEEQVGLFWEEVLPEDQHQTLLDRLDEDEYESFAAAAPGRSHGGTHAATVTQGIKLARRPQQRDSTREQLAERRQHGIRGCSPPRPRVPTPPGPLAVREEGEDRDARRGGIFAHGYTPRS
jgi:poly(3-hydroxybutyrate) depolymerase